MCLMFVMCIHWLVFHRLMWGRLLKLPTIFISPCFIRRFKKLFITGFVLCPLKLKLASMEGRKIVIAITGASGAVYAKVLLDKVARLKNQVAETAVLMSDNAKTVWEYELSGASWKDYTFRSEEQTSELLS